MLFRKDNNPSPKVEKLLPELQEYIRNHTPAVCHETPPSDEIRYSLPAGGPHVQYSIAFWDESEETEILDTYRSWEKQNSVRKSFSTEVIRIMEKKYSKPSAFYRAAGMNKRTFHKIKTDYGYKPSKKTAFRCCVGLRLNLQDAEDLLKLAGFSFSPSEPYDLIIRFCLEKEIRELQNINFLLSSFDLEGLDE